MGQLLYCTTFQSTLCPRPRQTVPVWISGSHARGTGHSDHSGVRASLLGWRVTTLGHVRRNQQIGWSGGCGRVQREAVAPRL